MEEIPGHIDSFFGVAGLSGAKTNYYKTFTVNYIANKYITEEYLKNRMSYGGTISYVTSTGGLYWDKYANEFEKFTNATTGINMQMNLKNLPMQLPGKKWKKHYTNKPRRTH